MKVLLVNDDLCVLTVLAKCFEHVGWDVVIAGGVQKAESSIPDVDVVVADYDIPNGGGKVVVASCAEHHKPVVVLTGDERVTHQHIVLKPTGFNLIFQAANEAVTSKSL